MKRIVMILTVALVMAVMLLAGGLPVFAQEGKSETAPNCEDGNNTAVFSPAGDDRAEQSGQSLDKNFFGPVAGKEQGAYCLQP